MENLEKKTEKLTFSEKIALAGLGIYGLATVAMGSYFLYNVSKMPEDSFNTKADKIMGYVIPAQIMAVGAIFTGLSYLGFKLERKNKKEG